MHGLQIQLLVALDGHKAHGWPADGFGDRFRVDVIVLVRLHVLRRDDSYFVTLLAQRTTQEMRSTTGFHTNQFHF